MFYSKLYLSDLQKVQSCIPSLTSLRNMKILITGANGLIGSAIVDFLLLANTELRLNNSIYVGARDSNLIKERFGEYCERSDFSFFEYNALNVLNDYIKFDYIVHAASPATPEMYTLYPVETMLANFLGLKNLLDYAKEKKVRRILYISSSEVYGNKNNSAPYIENDYGYVDILTPRACYPSSKRAAETLLISYQKEYNVDGIIVRPGHVYGPTATLKDTRASSAFFGNALEKHEIVMKSPGNQIRSYCYVVDVVSAIICVLLNGIPGEAYNISNKQSVVSIKELAKQIAETSQSTISFEFPTTVEQNSYNLMSNSSLNGKKLEELGWKGIFDISTGVEHTYQIMYENFQRK